MSRLHPSAPSQGAPPGAHHYGRTPPPPSRVAHVFGAAREPLSDSVPCSCRRSRERRQRHDDAGARSFLRRLGPGRPASCGRPPSMWCSEASSRASGRLRFAPPTSGPVGAREPSPQRPTDGLGAQAAALRACAPSPPGADPPAHALKHHSVAWNTAPNAKTPATIVS